MKRKRQAAEQLTESVRAILRKNGEEAVESPFLTIRGVGRLLYISRPQVYKLLAAKKLTRLKVGGRTLIRREEALSLVKEA